MASGPLRLGIVLALCSLLAGCGEATSETSQSEPEAAPAAPSGTVVLSPARIESLGIECAKVSRQSVSDFHATTGWAQVPPARQTVVRAPTHGFLNASGKNPFPQIGQSVAPADALFQLRVFLTPQEVAQLVAGKEETDIAIEQSLVSMRLAEEQLQKLQVAKDAVAGTKLQELREVYERSKAALNESRDKLPFLIEEPRNGDAVLTKPVPISSPIAGRIVATDVAPDQFVLQGDPLWTIADWSLLWVRVPVFEADLQALDMSKPAVCSFRNSSERLTARPLHLPLPTKAGLRTVDVFYEIDNSQGKLRDGQALGVDLPRGSISDRIVLPTSAILWDGSGGCWVFVRDSESTFRRQRVEVVTQVNDSVVIDRGLTGSEDVVVTGASSLYGEEFKGTTPAGDDD